MRVLTASNHWLTRQLAARYPRNIGTILQPSNKSRTDNIPYAVDNGMYACWSNKKPLNKEAFISLLDYCFAQEVKPLWVVVPDMPTDAEGTLKAWKEWFPVVKSYGFKTAFAAQNGMRLQDIPATTDYVFIGGSNSNWRNWAIKEIPPRLPSHVGRISGKDIWFCHCAGVESCDSSGWFRGDHKQLEVLLHYLKCVNLDFDSSLDLPSERPSYQQLSLVWDNATN